MTIVEILQVVATVLGALFLFGVTVFAHELGHFIAARWMGLYVDRFAIGMGPVVCKFIRNGVEYSIRWIPLGGFVSIPQMAPMESIEGKIEDVKLKDLPKATPIAKIVTAFFGPLFSLGLAFLLAIVVFFVGKNVNTTTLTTTIGFVDKASPAAEAGILPGDKIISINGEQMKTWGGATHSVQQSLLLMTTERADIVVERGGQLFEFSVPRRPDANPLLEKLHTVGFEKYWAMPLVVDKMWKDYPAAEAGLKRGDIVTAINGQRVYSPQHLAALVAEQKTTPFTLSFTRDGVEHSVAGITTKSFAAMEKSYLGIEWKLDTVELTYPTPMKQINDHLLNMASMVKALVSPKSGVGIQHMSGPLGILDLIRRFFVDYRELINFWVFLNVNLAVLNLLPLPILDGGHITFALVEWVTRRPLNVKFVNALMTGSMALLLCLFLFITYNDGARMWRTYKPNPKVEQQQKALEKIETVE